MNEDFGLPSVAADAAPQVRDEGQSEWQGRVALSEHEHRLLMAIAAASRCDAPVSFYYDDVEPLLSAGLIKAVMVLTDKGISALSTQQDSHATDKSADPSEAEGT